MSHFSSGQLNQLGNALEAADWTTDDVTRLGQSGKDRLTQIRLSLVYLRPLFTFKLGATDGKAITEAARAVFPGYFDPEFEKQGIVFSGIAPETELLAEELVQNGKFSDFLGNTAAEIEKRRLLGSQFLAICRDNPKKLRGEGRANFFVLTKGDEKVAEDLSNVFVANAGFGGSGQLHALLCEFRRDRVWYGVDGRRVFSPQQ